MAYTPIFVKDKQRFIVSASSFVGEDRWTARQIGWGASLVECILWRARFTHSILDLEKADAAKIQVIPADLGGVPVFLLGPPAITARR